MTISMKPANKSPISINGAFFATFEGRCPKGKAITSDCQVYVSKDVNLFYLSYDTMLDLGIINRGFPTIGNHPTFACASLNDHPLIVLDQDHAVCGAAQVNESTTTCKCPNRTPVPDRPSCFPFPCSPEDSERIKNWLLEHYVSSTFNTCPHQTLPTMSDPQVEIHLKKSATPRACHTAIPVPIHWQRFWRI